MRREPLTEGEVLEIVRLYNEGVTQRELARKFDRSVVQIGRYTRGESGATLIKGVPGRGAAERLLEIQAEVFRAQEGEVSKHLEFIRNLPASDTPQHIIDKAKELGGR